jgi:D-alanyl-D-alanine carboxypeptidase
VNRLYIFFCIVILSSCSSIPVSPCVSETGNVNRVEHEGLKKIIDSYSTANSDIGLQASVVMPDGMVLSAVSGYSDIKKKCPLTLECLLLTGSITKLYTATLIMNEVGEGKISLDEKIDKWINASWSKDVTVRMLLNHTSGIPSYTSSPFFIISAFTFRNRSWTTNQINKYFITTQLLFKPGSMYSYSNSNYVLLGIILEKTTGKKYGQLLKEKFQKSSTCFTCPPDMPLSNGYDRSLFHLGITDMTPFRTSFQTSLFSAGGIASTSKETASFAHDLFSGNILSPDSLNGMMKFVEVKDKDYPGLRGYGLGIKHFIIDGEDLYGQTGTVPGYSGIVLSNMKKGYTICILGNLSVIDQEGLVRQVQKTITKGL